MFGKTWGVSVARYCVLRERGVVDDDAFVVIHTRLVPLGFAEERFHPLPLWVFCLVLLISLLAFHKSSKMFSLCSGSRSLFVRRCSVREEDVIFRVRRATCRALCAWLRPVAGCSLPVPWPHLRRCCRVPGQAKVVSSRFVILLCLAGDHSSELVSW